MSSEESAWRNRVEWKIDRIAHHLIRLLLILPTSTPTTHTSPTSTGTGTRRLASRELVKALFWPTLKAIARWCGEKLVAYGATHVLPPLIGVWLIGRERWAKVWGYIEWFLP